MMDPWVLGVIGGAILAGWYVGQVLARCQGWP